MSILEKPLSVFRFGLCAAGMLLFASIHPAQAAKKSQKLATSCSNPTLKKSIARLEKELTMASQSFVALNKQHAELVKLVHRDQKLMTAQKVAIGVASVATSSVLAAGSLATVAQVAAFFKIESEVGLAVLNIGNVISQTVSSANKLRICMSVASGGHLDLSVSELEVLRQETAKLPYSMPKAFKRSGNDLKVIPSQLGPEIDRRISGYRKMMIAVGPQTFKASDGGLLWDDILEAKLTLNQLKEMSNIEAQFIRFASMMLPITAASCQKIDHQAAQPRRADSSKSSTRITKLLPPDALSPDSPSDSNESHGTVGEAL